MREISEESIAGCYEETATVSAINLYAIIIEETLYNGSRKAFCHYVKSHFDKDMKIANILRRHPKAFTGLMDAGYDGICLSLREESPKDTETLELKTGENDLRCAE